MNASTNDWQGVHEQLVRLAATRSAHEYEEAMWLLAGDRVEVYRPLGYASFVEYLERLFGYGPREAVERLRVARALGRLPALGATLHAGQLSWSAVRELSRVVTDKTEREWIAAAQGKSARQVERMVAGHTYGDLPDSPVDEKLRRHTLRFDVSAETYALWREAVKRLRAEMGGELSEDDALLEAARRVLGGPTDEGRSSYQIMLTMCKRCGDACQDGRGVEVPIADHVADMASCDAQCFDGDPAVMAPASQSIPPATRRLVMRRDRGQCVVDGCRASVFTDVHHLKLRSEGGDHDPEHLVVLCGSHHRAAHVGRLCITGTVSSGLAFFHADGSRYGSGDVNAAAVDAFTLAFAALRRLGCGETEAREALEKARPHVGPRAGPEEVLRCARTFIQS